MSDITTTGNIDVGKPRKPPSRMAVTVTTNMERTYERGFFYAAYLKFSVGHHWIEYRATADEKLGEELAIKCALLRFTNGSPHRWHAWHSRMWAGRDIKDIDFEMPEQYILSVQHAILIVLNLNKLPDDSPRLIEP